jgi:hypothetical protein
LILGHPPHSPRSRTGSRQGGKGRRVESTRSSSESALADVSGYIADDELYDGPFCVLSIVDNRTFKRLAYRVLDRDHDPNQADITACVRDFRSALDARGLTVRGITTDGSPLYPVPITEVFGKVPHQVCRFQILAELTESVLNAVAKLHKQLAAKKPKPKRGRPSTKRAKRSARRKKRLEQKIADLFEQRYLFVQHHLSLSEQKTLTRITRGLPQLRTLRSIMDEIYRLFDPIVSGIDLHQIFACAFWAP